MTDHNKTLAELSVMLARGQISKSEYEAARKIALSDITKDTFSDRTPLTADQPTEKNKKSIGCLGMLGVVLFFGFVISQCAPDKDNTSSTTKTSASEEKTTKQQKGFHCLSSWDGSNAALVKAVKSNLRDPSSFEHDKTKITPKSKENTHTIFMTYRAKNGFGGMNLSEAIGVVKNSDCSLVSWTGAS